MTDEQIFNSDICEQCGWKKDCKRCLALKNNIDQKSQDSHHYYDEDEECGTCGAMECNCIKTGDGNGENEDDDDDDDDFECDIERYVPFDDKMEFAEKMKNNSGEL